MWKAIYVSERGTSHLQDGTPCQDACRVRAMGGSVLSAVCADGAGSASHAREGAQLACRKFIECVSEFLNPPQLVEPVAQVENPGVGLFRMLWNAVRSVPRRVMGRAVRPSDQPQPPPVGPDGNATVLGRSDPVRASTDPLASLDREVLTKICGEIHDSLEARASELRVPICKLACTLLGAIVSDSSAVFIQIGDGAMVVGDGDGDGCDVVFWPQSGEYANTTNFLTDANFEKSLQFSIRRGRITEFAGFTDGLERLILQFDDRTVHRPALAPMFGKLRESADEKALFAPLRSFLRSEPVNARTNDDKTLILAVRNEDSGDAKAHLPG